MTYSREPLHEIKNAGLSLRLALGLALIIVLIILAPFVVINNIRLSIQYPLMAVFALVGSERVPDTRANMAIVLSRWQSALGMAFRIIFDQKSLNEKIYNVRGIYSYQELMFGIIIMGSTFFGISYLAKYLNTSSVLIAAIFVALCAVINLLYFLFIDFSRIMTYILWGPLGAAVCVSSTIVGYFLMLFDFVRFLFGRGNFDPQKYNNQEFTRYYSSFSKIKDGYLDRANFSWNDVNWGRAGRIFAQTFVFYVSLSLITFLATLFVMAG